jgi:tRNA pseudouridine55 synthase
MVHRLNGFLNVFKAPGETSQGVVSRVRRLTGQKKVGHAGTLDPAAVGVLPVALGNATRFTMGPGWSPKLYWADVTFGSSTDTDDAQGNVVATGDTTGLEVAAIEAALQHFLGDISQRPPSYSAVKIDGVRSYRLARGGKDAVASERRVHIDGLRIVGWEQPVLSIVVQCGSGTYVRSLARDLGSTLECPAHLSALVRLRVGPFDAVSALHYDELDAIAERDAWDEVLWPVDLPIQTLPAAFASLQQEQDFVHGRAWEVPGAQKAAQLRVYAEAGTLLGLASISDARLQPTMVFESAQ